MTRLGRLLTAAALAALVAGVVFTGMQQAMVVPPLLAAEAVEEASQSVPPAHAEAPHAHAEGFDARRTALTAAANIAIALGFALLLGAAMTLTGKDGWRAGLAWGLAGYAVFFVLPSFLLPPEVPGTESGALRPRQLTWLLVVAASASGLWISVFCRRLAVRLAGVAMLVTPQFARLPTPTPPPGVPGDVVEAFAWSTYLANAILWMSLGAFMGFLHRRMLRAHGLADR
jgi:cobalt transporter subunit CbtA